MLAPGNPLPPPLAALAEDDEEGRVGRARPPSITERDNANIIGKEATLEVIICGGVNVVKEGDSGEKRARFP